MSRGNLEIIAEIKLAHISCSVGMLLDILQVIHTVAVTNLNLNILELTVLQP